METEKRPGGAGWEEGEVPSQLLGEATPISMWVNGRFRAISELKEVELPGGGIGPTWIISISRMGARRPRIRETRRLLRDFGMWPCEEDNHEPGIARKFWLPVDPAERGICECKTDEEQVVEPDGYTWSRLQQSGE